MSPTPPVNVAVLISGGGRSLQNLHERIRQGTLPARISVVVSSKPGVPGIERARAMGAPVEVVDRKELPDAERFGAAVWSRIDPHAPDLVALAGFLHLLPIPGEYAGRVMNIHPALLPAFGGRGFYGDRVHQAVLRSGAKVSGCTVHFVDNEYDHGPIILQRVVAVHDDDDSHTLADRVFHEECEAYPEAIRLFGAGRLKVEACRVRILL